MKKNRNRFISTEIRLMVARDEVCSRAKKVKRSIQDSHGNVEYNIGNIVPNIIITTYGTRCILEISREQLCKVYDCVTSVFCT